MDLVQFLERLSQRIFVCFFPPLRGAQSANGGRISGDFRRPFGGVGGSIGGSSDSNSSS